MMQTETQAENLQELVVYCLISPVFQFSNIYPLDGTRPNAKYIAEQYGCKLGFRISEFRDNPNSSVNRRHFGIGEDGTCISAVLIGEDMGKMARARDDIQRTFGVDYLDFGTFRVGKERALFG